MKLCEYKDYILTMLGAPLLDVEIDIDENKVMDKVIKAAFLELREYIDTPFYQTIASSSSNSGIDVSKYNVRAILYVTRGDINFMNASENTEALLWSPLTTMMTQTINYGYNNTYSQSDFLQDYMASLRYRQLRNTLNQDLDFTYDSVNKKLYVFQQIPIADTITMVYNKYFEDVEEIKDPYWVNLMLRLSTAYAKMIVGRIRSKYTMASAPYTLDGNTLLSEAQSELAEIRAFLNENNNIFIPRD